MNSKLIIALDFDDQYKTLKMVDSLNPDKCHLKIGSELFTRFGPQLVQKIISKGYRIFLDLKFHDIPNTVAASCKAAADLGVWMFNVHATGGPLMLESAVSALSGYGHDKPILIAVTILTSIDDNQYDAIGFNKTISQQAHQLAALAKSSGLDGVVCSALDVKDIKQDFGKHFMAVTPGIRPLNSELNDQNRVMTPREAVEEGSDYLVVGRPVTRASNPQAMVDQILLSMGY